MIKVVNPAEVVNDFIKSLESCDEALIEHYTREQIDLALIKKCSHPEDKKRPHVQYMIQRRDELKELKTQKRETKEKWKDRIFGFVSGVVLTLLGQWLATKIF